MCKNFVCEHAYMQLKLIADSGGELKPALTVGGGGLTEKM